MITTRQPDFDRIRAGLVDTWLVVFVLYVWGGPGVHLFAFVMVVV